MAKKTIQPHRTRLKQTNETLKTNPRYKRERYFEGYREAFVEF